MNWHFNTYLDLCMNLFCIDSVTQHLMHKWFEPLSLTPAPTTQNPTSLLLTLLMFHYLLPLLSCKVSINIFPDCSKCFLLNHLKGIPKNTINKFLKRMCPMSCNTDFICSEVPKFHAGNDDSKPQITHIPLEELIPPFV